MQRTLSQNEIDSLIEALNTIKTYGDTGIVNEDILKNQVVLTQSQIDKLITRLRTEGENGFLIDEPDVRVVLTQPEIDSLVEALNTIKKYDEDQDFTREMTTNQSVLSQDEIDRLIVMLLGSRTTA